MDPSNPANFTNLLNSTNTNQESENTSGQYYQQFPPSHFPMNLAASQYAPNFHPHQYPQNIHPFGIPTPFQNFPRGPPNFQGSPYHSNARPATHGVFGGGSAGLSSSPVESKAVFGAAGATGSCGDESASPISTAQLRQPQPVAAEEVGESSPDEEIARGRQNWSKEENLQLISAWLNNSLDPIGSNNKKYDYFWKQIVDEYNSNSPFGCWHMLVVPHEQRERPRVGGGKHRWPGPWAHRQGRHGTRGTCHLKHKAGQAQRKHGHRGERCHGGGEKHQ